MDASRPRHRHFDGMEADKVMIGPLFNDSEDAEARGSLAVSRVQIRTSPAAAGDAALRGQVARRRRMVAGKGPSHNV
ncbi:hypothetical protein MGN01_40840 [Methylobacterium gnaphalii]|uniref:Uncharacterized protein n=1 Tax=Methylobacterium gnaphalii TaxID=1010610 RepID=A0A512JQL7_9HYPH|nr:hypothetical protein MGN01_40840 [Methylobacterium gnaphalii]GLS48522.1 hypothetical protein GCM10007885_13660 [Methylobacterium gnaphalii]